MGCNYHTLAPTKKYVASKPAAKVTKVALLLKDDASPYLTTAQRTVLLGEVEKEYTRAKEEQRIAAIPKLSLAHVSAQFQEGKLTFKELLQGLKEGWVVK
ncbi:MAG: hypothetical protein AAB780_01935 [Patescibacteria group bacterium]